MGEAQHDFHMQSNDIFQLKSLLILMLYRKKF